MKFTSPFTFPHCCRFLPALAALSVLLPSHAAELEIRGEPTPASDIKVLPPVCKLILVERPGIHHFGGQRDHPEVFEPPQYRMAKNNPHLHHYCWSLVHKLRYFRARDQNERNYRYSQFMGDIDYVLKHSDPNWQYFHTMLLEQGDLMLVRRDFAGALAKAGEALRRKPGEERAFVLMFDAYMAMGDKKKAIHMAQEGLEHNPRSKPLRRRLEREGVKLAPLPALIPASAQVEAQATNPAVTDPADSPVVTPPNGETQAAPSATPQEPEKPANPDNPYCRFCP